MRLDRIVLLLLLVLVVACNNDDDGDNIEVVPPTPLSEQEPVDDAAIQEYLNTHFYNYEEFAAPPVDFDFKIRIDTIAGDNAGKTPMMQQVETVKVNVKSEDLGLEDAETVEHTLYYLTAREGVGEKPTVADSTLINYEGNLLDGSVFDTNTYHTWQYLPFFLRGYALGASQFKVGDQTIDNPDGTAGVANGSVGLIVMPSALGYYSSTQSKIPAYSPLVFQLNVGLYVPETDYDGDGVPSIMEDLNGDGLLSNDNTDGEAEADAFQNPVPNHLDIDDDGDGTPTIEEIVIDDQGNISFPDSNGNGIPDYLDPSTD